MTNTLDNLLYDPKTKVPLPTPSDWREAAEYCMLHSLRFSATAEKARERKDHHLAEICEATANEWKNASRRCCLSQQVVVPSWWPF